MSMWGIGNYCCLCVHSLGAWVPAGLVKGHRDANLLAWTKMICIGAELYLWQCPRDVHAPHNFIVREKAAAGWLKTRRGSCTIGSCKNEMPWALTWLTTLMLARFRRKPSAHIYAGRWEGAWGDWWGWVCGANLYRWCCTPVLERVNIMDAENAWVDTRIATPFSHHVSVWTELIKENKS